MDYKFGTKNNWRRWQANRIAERVNPATATVLYLAGEQDADRKILLDRGFRNSNLIAVERDPVIVASLRSKGVLVAQGDLFEVLRVWPLSKKLDVVIADFVSDLSFKSCDMATSILSLPHLWETTFAYNFLKGRDASMRDLRNYYVGGDKRAAHRGQLLFDMIVANFFKVAVELDEEVRRAVFEDFERTAELGVELIRSKCIPIYNEYKSQCGQHFNSVVFTNKVANGLENVMAGHARNGVRTITKRRVAAIAAHHTMRNQISRVH